MRLFVSAPELAISHLTPSAGMLRPEAREEQRDPAGEEAEQSGRTGEPARVPPAGAQHRLVSVSHGHACVSAGSWSNTQRQRHGRLSLGSCFQRPWTHIGSGRVVVREISRLPCLLTVVSCHRSETPSVSVSSLTHQGKTGHGCSLVPGAAN